MLKSKSEELGEFEIIRKPDHIEKVRAVLERKFDQYFDSLLGSNRENPAIKILNPHYSPCFRLTVGN
jgi:hypothetical protein